jgi:hypothetical protein
LCLEIKSSYRNRKGLTQDFSVVKVVVKNEQTGQVVLEKSFASNEAGVVQIPAGDLTGILDDASTKYSVFVKITGHLRVGSRGQVNLRGRGSACLPLPESPTGDFNSDGQVTRGDVTSVIEHYRRENDAVLQEIFKGKPDFREIIHLVKRYVEGGRDE